MERIPHILERLASLEAKAEVSDRLLRSSVDDIKATIRSEISDLKSEQIADMKVRLNELSVRVDRNTERLDRMEHTQLQWKTGTSIINWMIRFAIGIGGLAIGIVGAKHVGG